MNEERQEAYLNLIQSLLSFRRNKKKIQEILAANQNLLDANFLRVLEVVAEVKSESGQENTAIWLRNLAASLTPENTPITEADIEIYWGFLQEVLRTISESDGDADVIHLLLAANTDKLNNIFAELLRYWATDTLLEAEAKTAEYIAYRDLNNYKSKNPLTCHECLPSLYFLSKINNLNGNILFSPIS